MEVYGETDYVITANNTAMRVRNAQSNAEQAMQVTAKEVAVYRDLFSYFAGVLRGKIKVAKNSLYSLDNNITVVQILEAARESAKSGKTVFFKNSFK